MSKIPARAEKLPLKKIGTIKTNIIIPTTLPPSATSSDSSLSAYSICL